MSGAASKMIVGRGSNVVFMLVRTYLPYLSVTVKVVSGKTDPLFATYINGSFPTPSSKETFASNEIMMYVRLW